MWSGSFVVRFPEALRAIMVFFALLWPIWGAAANTPRPAKTVAQVEAAAEKLRADPDIISWEEVGRFKPRYPQDEGLEEIEPEPRRLPGMAELMELMRTLVWVLGAMLLAWVLWRLKFWAALRAQDPGERLEPALATHFERHDIRPESLPSPLGAHAWRLWQGQSHRAALSLLYRGVLSGLAHEYGLPVSISTTERDCIRMARSALPAALQGYVEQVVGTWQAAVFGGSRVEDAEIEALCRRFDDEFAARPRPVNEARP